MEDTHRSGLYRWQRQSKSKVQSRSQKIATTDDIQDWIKKVEHASDKAADAAFGLIASGKERGRAVAQRQAGLVRDQEHAYSEAQELLTQWVNEKVTFDDDDGFDDFEAWRRKRAANKANNGTVPSESGEFNWDRIGVDDEDVDIDEAAIYERVKRSAFGDEDPYSHLYEMEEGEAVSTVMSNMLKKDVVKGTVRKDLGLGDKSATRPDPRTKMEMRHLMVKENRQKRQKVEEDRKVEAQMKKEARLQAQQLILKEQRDREIRTKKEEMKTKNEMAQIRKELRTDMKRKEDELRREREERERMDVLAKEELQRQMESEEKAMLEAHRQASERKKQHMVKVELFKAKQVAKNLKILHQHFTSWYDLVLSRRLLLGKVKAMSDWKLMVKVWGAWRSHAKGQRIELETVIHERNVIDTQRKILAAERHYTLFLLRNSFQAWQFFVNETIERREMKKDQEKTKNKMMSLLNAVAEGHIHKDEGGDRTGRNSAAPGNPQKHASSARSDQLSSDRHGMEQQFQQPVRRQAWSGPEDITSSRSESSLSQSSLSSRAESAMGKGKRIPTEAWQVNRQHLKLTKEEISDLGQQREGGVTPDLTGHSGVEVRRRFGTQPWMNRHYVVNNFEHRYTAQQQALREQQGQIREQQRLIEELQYAQRQQLLRKQLEDSNTIVPPAPPVPQGPPPGWQLPRGDEVLEPDCDGPDRSAHSTGRTNENVSDHLGPGPPSQNIQNNQGLQTDRSSLTTVTTARSERSLASTRVSSTSGKGQDSRYLQVLKNMEDRAAERNRLKAERDEKRRMQEEAKLAELKRVEEETLREMEVEKKAKAEAYRQKKRLEKQRAEEKERQAILLQEQTKRAEEHHQRSLLKYRGLLPFKKLISLVKRHWALAIKHRDRTVVRQCLRAWILWTNEEISRKRAMADHMHEFLVIKHSFQKWRNFKHHQQFLERRAERYHCENIRARCFSAWVDWLAVEREDMLTRMETAHDHYLRSLMRRSFLSWRYLPERQKREEERQKRKLELRLRVTQLIPDYVPHKSVEVVDSQDQLS